MLLKILLSLLLIGLSSGSVLAAPDVQSLIDTGNRQWSEGKTSEAEISFKQAISADPGSANAYSRLASLYLTENRLDEAISNYQEAIMRDAENPRLFLAVSVAYLHQAHYEMAQAMVQQALELDPQLEDALKVQEYIRIKQKTLKEAERTEQSDKPEAHP